MEPGTDTLELSNHALSALIDYYSEQDAQKQRYEDLKAAAIAGTTQLSMDAFQEDWNMSQFWYTDTIAKRIAQALLSNAGPDSSIAVLCVPSVYIQLKNLLASRKYDSPRICLFEFDERFAALDGYVKYDCNTPLDLSPELEGQFDVFVCDPPFLKADTHAKTATTLRWLSKNGNASAFTASSRIAICTGACMERTICKLYPGVGCTSLKIEHGRNGLSNDYACFANFECDQWTWFDEEST